MAAMTPPVPLANQLAEVRRECALRERVYANWVLEGRMTVVDSATRIRRLGAVRNTLEALEAMRRPAERPAATLAEQIGEVKRELGMRRRVYPRYVAAGKADAQEAERRIAAMAAALDTLEALAAVGRATQPELGL
jgi:hypothetical protein